LKFVQRFLKSTGDYFTWTLKFKIRTVISDYICIARAEKLHQKTCDSKVKRPYVCLVQTTEYNNTDMHLLFSRCKKTSSKASLPILLN